MGVYVALIGFTVSTCSARCRRASCRTQDKQYLVGLREAARRRVARPYRGGHPPHDGHRLEAPGGEGFGGLRGPVDQRLHHQPERGHRVLRPEGLQGPPRIRDVAVGHVPEAERGPAGDPGRFRDGVPGAGGGRPRDHRRLPAATGGSRQRRHAGARRRVAGRDRPGLPDAGTGRRVLELHHQGAADLRRRGSREGEAHGRQPERHLRDAADQPGLALRQRLQPLRPHLPGDRAGGRGSTACSPRASAS